MFLKAPYGVPLQIGIEEPSSSTLNSDYNGALIGQFDFNTYIQHRKLNRPTLFPKST